MDYRVLGRSGIKVSPLCLGTMMFGGPTSPATAQTIMDHARDAGVNFIDTANVYTQGQSEEIIGPIVARHRDHWVLATKIGNPTGPGVNDRGLAPRAVLRDTEQSLKRLGLEVIDILYLHIDDESVPLDETLLAVQSVIRAGKVLHFGLSNFRGWRIAEVIRVCGEIGLGLPAVVQPYYNAANRQPELEIIPACAHYGLGVAAYSPLARGVLTGKYIDGAADPQSRAGRKDARIFQTEMREESNLLATRIAAQAAEKGFGAVHFAFAWVIRNTHVTCGIGGPRTLEQWQDYIRALTYPWDETDEALVDSLVASGHPSTPGYNDPLYPIRGRKPVFSTQ